MILELHLQHDTKYNFVGASAAHGLMSINITLIQPLIDEPVYPIDMILPFYSQTTVTLTGNCLILGHFPTSFRF